MSAVRWLRGAYWLLLGLWAGSLLGFALAAPRVFAVVRRLEPSLGVEPYNHPAFAERQADILAGAVVNGVTASLLWVHWLCAIGLLACLVGQRLVLPRRAVRLRVNRVREGALALAVVLLMVFSFLLSPRMNSLRERVYDPQRPAETRQADRARFDRLHRWSERTMGLTLAAVLTTMLSSPFVVNRGPRE